MPRVVKFSDVEELFNVKYEAAHDFHSFIYGELKASKGIDAAQVGAMYLQILQLRLDDLASEED